jgi:hypothetical protein
MLIFNKEVWIEEIKKAPVSWTVGGIFSLLMTGIIHRIGVPSLDNLAWPLTGLGYALIFFIVGFGFFGLLGAARWATDGLASPDWTWLSTTQTRQRERDAAGRHADEVWLLDAVFYAVHGGWPTGEDQLYPAQTATESVMTWRRRIEASETHEKALDALVQIRQSAGDGKLLFPEAHRRWRRMCW